MSEELTVIVYPQETILVNGTKVNIYRAIKRSKLEYMKVRSGGRQSIMVNKKIVTAIKSYEAQGGFAGLNLVDYLNTLFV